MLFLQQEKKSASSSAPRRYHFLCASTIRIAQLFIHVEGGSSNPVQLIILNVAV